MQITKNMVAILGAIVLVLILVVYMSWPKLPKQVDTQQILNDALAIAKKPLLAEIENQKKKVADYKSRLYVSDAKYKTLVQKYTELQKEKENVKPPTTDAELRDRFIALGFVPLAVTAVPIK